jgi:CheY-like chemotaxis protein
MPLTGSRPQTTELPAGTVDVLIVDDDDAFREGLVESIQQVGFVTAGAANGAEALRMASDRPPRVILLDLQMPVLNGWQFLERRRSDGALSKIPVIIVSAFGTETASRRDVDGYLEKPFEQQRLLAAIDGALSSPGADAARSPQPGHPATILVVEDDEDTLCAVVELLQDHGYRVARARNGQEAEVLLQKDDRLDCVVVDLWMPVMNGWTFTSRLRQRGEPAIPIVVITAAEPYWGYPVPAGHVVRKPLHSDTFLALIRKLVPSAPVAEEPSAAIAGLTSRRPGPGRAG